MSTVETTGTLSEAEKDAIRDFGTHYPEARAACIEALKFIQRHHNHVSDGQIAEIAGLLGMSAAELDGVATFYNLIFRKPVGRHVVLLCDSASCWIMGRDAVASYISRKVGVKPGETTADGRLTLLPTVCLGHCDHAPAMMIGDALHGEVDITAVDKLLEALE